jgi:hypothetical protein
MMPGVPPPERGGGVLTSGWGKAILRGVIAFLIMALLGQLLAFLSVADDPQSAAFLDVVRIGGVLLFLFHRVGVTVDVPTINVPETADSPFSGPVDFSASFGVALMLATALAAWLLYRGGRATAEAAGGRPLARAVHGAKIAVPYALLMLGVSFLVSFRLPLPPLPFLQTDEPVRLGLSPVQALLWPLGLALLFGVLGGLSTARSEFSASLWRRRIVAALGGGWRMAWVGLVLAFLGYLVVAFLNPDVPLPFGPEYFSEVAAEESVTSAVLLVLFTILVVPNIASLVLVPAMGGALGFFGSVTGVRVSCNLLSYTRFPVGALDRPPDGSGLDPCAGLPIEFTTAPALYFAFLLVPVIATILGGRVAARRAEVTGPAEGAGTGALAGVAFAVLVLLISVFASVAFQVTGATGGATPGGGFSVGPGLLVGTVLALAWGAAGGALGGASVGRQRAPAAPTAGTPEPGGATGFGRATTGFEPSRPPQPPEGS